MLVLFQGLSFGNKFFECVIEIVIYVQISFKNFNVTKKKYNFP